MEEYHKEERIKCKNKLKKKKKKEKEIYKGLKRRDLKEGT